MNCFRVAKLIITIILVCTSTRRRVIHGETDYVDFVGIVLKSRSSISTFFLKKFPTTIKMCNPALYLICAKYAPGNFAAPNDIPTAWPNTCADKQGGVKLYLKVSCICPQTTSSGPRLVQRHVRCLKFQSGFFLLTPCSMNKHKAEANDSVAAHVCIYAPSSSLLPHTPLRLFSLQWKAEAICSSVAIALRQNEEEEA